MKILLDNIIFSHQKSGGVSVYWYELIGRFINQVGVDVHFLDYKDGYKNIFRGLLLIDDKYILNSEITLVITVFRKNIVLH